MKQDILQDTLRHNEIPTETMGSTQRPRSRVPPIRHNSLGLDPAMAEHLFRLAACGALDLGLIPRAENGR